MPELRLIIVLEISILDNQHKSTPNLIVYLDNVPSCIEPSYNVSQVSYIDSSGYHRNPRKCVYIWHYAFMHQVAYYPLFKRYEIVGFFMGYTWMDHWSSVEVRL